MTTTAHEDQFTADTERHIAQPYDVTAILRKNVADLERELQRQRERADKAESAMATAREDLQSFIDSRDAWMARAKKAEAELKAAHEQEPVAYLDYWKSDGTGVVRKQQSKGFKLYASPIPKDFLPAPAPAVQCSDCGMAWNDPQKHADTCVAEMLRQDVPAPAVPDGDDFNGTTPHLIQCMEALVRLDADGVLVPHGIGRDASKLLSAAANRLRKQPAPSVPEEWREVMAELAADLQSGIEAEYAYRDQYSSVMRKYQNDMRIVERARALLQSAGGWKC